MDKFEMIKQFKDLLDNDIISQEEFDQKKNELLGLTDDENLIKADQVDVSKDMTEDCGEIKAEENKPSAYDSSKETAIPEEVMDASEIVVDRANEEPAEGNDTTAEAETGNDLATTETSDTAEKVVQKDASKKGKILIGVIAAVVVLFFIGILGSGGSSGIKGSWNCYSVTYLGETITASEAQMDDYTFKFASNTFEANIYGEEVSGTYAYSETVTLDDGTEADVYTLTTESGAELTVAYFKSVKLLTMSPFGGVSDSTYIAFKRR